MARHRSPSGRRAHLGPPLRVAPAAAGVGGAIRTPTILLPQLTSSLAVRFVATAVAGSALAAAGQHALTQSLPAADGADVLRLGVDEVLRFVGTEDALGAAVTVRAAQAPVVAPLTPIAPLSTVAPEPVVVDAGYLVKAADLQRQAAEAAEAALEAARVSESAGAAAGGGVQMVVARVTSGFGLRGGTSHQGIDLAAPIGTPIRVPLDGTVIDSGPASGFGMWVRVSHDDGTITVYGHINRSFVRVGERVQAGEVIAEVGNQGRSSGPHLHFEVINPGGTTINPRPWLDDLGIGYL